KMFPPKIQAAYSAPQINCPRATPARFRSSPLCGELSLRVWSTAQCPGSLFSGTVAPSRREKIHRQTQDRHEAARYAQKVPQHPDARPSILARVRSRRENVGIWSMLQPREDTRAEGKHLEQRRVRSDMKDTV